jgi:glycosyltransferase involved in cell wall biosynthesis
MCLDSIVNQSFKDIEIICINDGSTDNSLEILKEYALKDNRFVIISQENQGQGIARNKGIDIAKGQYILFVDPDDWIAEGALESIYNEFQKTNVDIIQFDYIIVSETTGVQKVKTFEKQSKKCLRSKIKSGDIFNVQYFTKRFFRGIPMAVWNKAYSNEFIIKNDIKFPPNKHAEDHLFSIKAYSLAKNILYKKTPLYFYRDRLGSSVNILSDANFCIFDNLDLIQQFLINAGFYQRLEKEFKKYSIGLMGTHFNSIELGSKEKWKEMAKKRLSKEDYRKFLSRCKSNRSFIENIFSLRNKKIEGIKYKVITILGIEYQFKTVKGER